MNFGKISKIFSIIIFFSLNNLINGSNLSINSPANGATVDGEDLLISGSSSCPNYTLRIFINNSQVTNIKINGNGSWSFNYYDLPQGNYSVKAEVVGVDEDSCFCILYSVANNFTVSAPTNIKISEPTEDENIPIYHSNITGIASLISAFVRITIDNNVITTVTTDELGNWTAPYPSLENGSHTLLAELLSGGDPVASYSLTFTSIAPLLTPTNNLQLQIVEGNIPTTGSGSGIGFDYIISGSIATINFEKEFPSSPVVIATGQYSSGASTVTISSSSSASCSFSFSTGTERIHFSAKEFL